MSAPGAIGAPQGFGRVLFVGAGLFLAGLLAMASALGLGSASAAGSGQAKAGSPPLVLGNGAGQDLTVPEIGALAARAGFSGAGLVMAIAVALAESGGDAAATDFDDNGTVDRGVWQINSVHSQYSAACDYDPPCAAGAVFAISSGGTDWSAWVTYQQGAEIAYLPGAVAYVERTRPASGPAS